jgi:hypothetical protein
VKRGAAPNTQVRRVLLVAAFVIGPALVGAGTMGTTFQQSEDVAFCASCHTMTPYIRDMTDPESESLAAAHYSNRWIADSQCYTCHTGPGLSGFAAAKLRGLRHSYVYYLQDPDGELALYSPYSNENCLGCHVGARSYEDEFVHELFGEELGSGTTTCIEAGCHGSVHPKGLHDETLRARKLNDAATEVAVVQKDTP